MTRTRALFLLVLWMLLSACGSPEDRVSSYLASGQDLFDQDDLERATIEVKSALQIQPKNAQGRYLMAEIAIKKEDYRAAIDHLMIATESEPDLLKPHVLLGEIYYLAKQADKLEEQLAVAEVIAPEDAEVLLLRSRLLSMSNDLDGALAKVDDALAANRGLESAIIFRASLLVRSGDPDAGLKHLDEYIATLDLAESERVRKFKIIYLDAVGRNPEVEAELRSLVNDFPETSEYAQNLAARFVGAGRVDDAEQVLRDMAARDTENTRRRLDLVGFLANQRGVDSAEKALKDFIAADPENAELLLSLAQLYDSQAELDEALETYEKVVDLAGNSDPAFEARNRIASVRMRQGQPVVARELVNAILAERPDNVDALLSRAIFNYSEGRFDEVIADARIALRKDPKSTPALMLLARAHAGSGNVLMAQDAYQNLLMISPNNAEAVQELSASFARQGDYGNAEALLRDRIAAAPADMRTRSELIGVLLAKNELANAEKEARLMGQIDGADYRSDLELARVLQAEQKYEEAVEVYRRVLDDQADLPIALQGLTSSLIAVGAPDDAVKFLTAYTGKNPEVYGAKLLLAQAHLAAGRKSVGRNILEEIIAADALGITPYVRLASAFTDDIGERIDLLLRATGKYPDNLQAKLLLAEQYRQNDEVPKAIAIYEAAIAKDSRNDVLVNNYAALLLDSTDDADTHARALELAKRFNDSREPAMLDTLGWAYYKNAQYAFAVRYLENAVALSGDTAATRYHLGKAYLASGNRSQGRKELEKSVAMANTDFPGLSDAKSVLADLQNTAPL